MKTYGGRPKLFRVFSCLRLMKIYFNKNMASDLTVKIFLLIQRVDAQVRGLEERKLFWKTQLLYERRLKRISLIEKKTSHVGQFLLVTPVRKKLFFFEMFN